LPTPFPREKLINYPQLTNIADCSKELEKSLLDSNLFIFSDQTTHQLTTIDKNKTVGV
jgi:hypothetical protein